MRKIIQTCMAVLCSILFFACEYEPTQVYQRDVNRNVIPPLIQTVELNLGKDTVFLYSDKNISFRFQSSAQKIKAVRFVLDGNEKSIITSQDGKFNLNYLGLTEGTHTLAIEVYTGSGTGSIADLVGAEGFVSTKSWKVVVDKSYYSRAKASAVNGLLKLSWAEYKSDDFKEYVISRRIWSSNFEIARVKTLDYLDSTYVGESAEFEVRVITKDNKSLYWASYSLLKDLPKLDVSTTSNNELKVSWKKSTYYEAVDTFELSRQLNNSYIRIKSIHDPDESSVTIPGLIFGDNIRLRLRLIPKKENILLKTLGYSMFDITVEGKLGFHFKSGGIDNLRPVNQNEFVFLSGCDSLIRFSVSEKRIVEKLGYSPVGCYTCSFSRISYSPSGKFITSYVGCDDRVMLTNSSGLTNYAIYNLKNYTGDYYVPEIIPSDNGRAIINSNKGGFYLYDFNSSASYLYKGKLSGGSGLKISPNGDYLFLRDDSFRLVKFKDAKFSNIWSQTYYNDIKYYEFDPANNEQIFIWNGSTFSINRCSDFSKITEFPLKDALVLNVDYYNREILTYSTGHLYIRSLSDGSLLKDIPTSYNVNYYYLFCYLVNRNIVSLDGYIYHVN